MIALPPNGDNHLDDHSEDRVPKLKMSAVVEALRTTHGLVSYAARLLKISDSKLYRIISKHPKLQEICALSRHALVDAAELSLRNAASAREGWAVQLLMKSPIARYRGLADAPSAMAGINLNITSNQLNPLLESDSRGNAVIQPVSELQQAIKSLAAQPDYVAYAQHRASQECQPIGVDGTNLVPLLGASLIGGNSGVSRGDSEPG